MYKYQKYQQPRHFRISILTSSSSVPSIPCHILNSTFAFQIYSIQTDFKFPSLSRSLYHLIPDPAAKWLHCQRKRQQQRKRGTSSRGASNVLLVLVSCSLFLSQFVPVTSSWSPGTAQTPSSSIAAVPAGPSPSTTTTQSVTEEGTSASTTPSPVTPPPPSRAPSEDAAVSSSPSSVDGNRSSPLGITSSTAATRPSTTVSPKTGGGGAADPEMQADDGGVEIGQPPLPPQFMTQCAMSEHTCNNGRCIPLNKFCDSVNDCGDSSDEPRFCTSE